MTDETINTEQTISQQMIKTFENVAAQLYNALYKEVKRNIRLEGEDYQTGYQQGYAAGKKTLVEHFPMWQIAPEDDYLRETVLAGCSDLGMRVLHRGQLIKAGWKYIPIKALKILPVEKTEEDRPQD